MEIKKFLTAADQKANHKPTLQLIPAAINEHAHTNERMNELTGRFVKTKEKATREVQSR